MCVYNCIFPPFSASSEQNCILYSVLNYSVVIESKPSLLQGSVLLLQQRW